MRIDNTHNINNLLNKKDPEVKKEDLFQEVKIKLAAVYEKSNLEDKSQVYDLSTIEQLSKESEDLLGQLKEMVEEMLTNQGKTLELLKQEDIMKENIGRHYMVKENTTEADGVRVDENTIAKVKQLIRPEGPLGEETVSEEIVDFVKLASEGEMGKLDVLIEAIDKGFKEMESILGKLPEISKKTYNRIMKKLDSFISLEILKKEPENAEIQLKKMIEEMVTNQSKASELLQQGDILGEGIVKQNTSKDDMLHQNIVKTDIVESEMLKEQIVKDSLIKSDEDIISEAKDLIGQGKRADIEYISGKVLDFVKLASGGDREKLDTLRESIDKGFSEAEKNLGLLPEVSQKTYSSIMEKLNNWEKELERRRYPGWPIFAESMNFYRRLKEYNRFGIKTYITIILGSIILYYGLRCLM